MNKTKAQKIAFTITLVVFLSALITFAKNFKNPNPFSRWQPQADIVFNTEIKEVITKNGLKAWLIEDKTTPIVAVSIIFNGGRASDNDNQNGLTTMVASLLSEGAGNLDSIAFNNILEQKAIMLSFGNDLKSFTVSLQSPYIEIEPAFELLALALTAPRFDSEPITRTKDVIKTALKQRLQSPSYMAEWEWQKQAFPNSPYSRQNPADIVSLNNITKKDLHHYIKTRFAKDNIFIGVAGAITSDELSLLLDKNFKDLPPKSQIKRLPAMTINEFASPAVVSMPIPQSLAVFGHNGISRDDKDFYPAYLMNYILGEGSFSSRLMEEVRSKQGLAYGVETNLLPSKNIPLIKGSVATSNNDFEKSMKIITAEWQKMREFGVTEQELKDAKDYLTASFPLRFSSSITIASMLSYIQFENLGIDFFALRNSYIANVTREEVNQVAKKILAKEPLFAVAGTPILTNNE